jgi:hypothetical protein
MKFCVLHPGRPKYFFSGVHSGVSRLGRYNNPLKVNDLTMPDRLPPSAPGWDCLRQTPPLRSGPYSFAAASNPLRHKK